MKKLVCIAVLFSSLPAFAQDAREPEGWWKEIQSKAITQGADDAKILASFQKFREAYPALKDYPVEFQALQSKLARTARISRTVYAVEHATYRREDLEPGDPLALTPKDWGVEESTLSDEVRGWIQDLRARHRAGEFRFKQDWLQKHLRFPGFFKIFDPSGEMVAWYAENDLLSVDAFSRTGGFSNPFVPKALLGALFERSLEAMGHFVSLHAQEMEKHFGEGLPPRDLPAQFEFSYARSAIYQAVHVMNAIPMEAEHDAQVLDVLDTLRYPSLQILALTESLEGAVENVESDEVGLDEIRKRMLRLADRSTVPFEETRKPFKRAIAEAGSIRRLSDVKAGAFQQELKQVREWVKRPGWLVIYPKCSLALKQGKPGFFKRFFGQ